MVKSMVESVARGAALVLALGGCTRVTEPDPAPPAAPPAAPAPRPPRPQSRPSPWPSQLLPAAARPVDAAPVLIPTADTLNGDPKGLKKEEISAALQKALPSLAPCLGAAGSGNVGLSFDASPEGRARNIKVTNASPETERCVSSTLADLKLPTFEGKSVPLDFPLTVHRPDPPAPVAAEPPPAGPPRTATSTGAYLPPTMSPSGGASTAKSASPGSAFIQP
jgi:hypothetical protein